MGQLLPAFVPFLHFHMYCALMNVTLDVSYEPLNARLFDHGVRELRLARLCFHPGAIVTIPAGSSYVYGCRVANTI